MEIYREPDAEQWATIRNEVIDKVLGIDPEMGLKGVIDLFGPEAVADYYERKLGRERRADEGELDLPYNGA